MPRELWDACDKEGNSLGFDLVRGDKLLPYEAFKRFLLEDRFVDVVRRRFLDHQEDFDRIVTEHFK